MKTMEVLQIEKAAGPDHRQRTEYTSLIDRIHDGMEVRSSDGLKLGKVMQVWCGDDSVSSSARLGEETGSRLEVGRRGRDRIYIPYSAVDEVVGKSVTLSVSAEAAASKGWNRKPGWIPEGEGASSTVLGRRLLQAMATSLQRC